MKIVVTGGSGFVGRALIPLLVSAGADVLVVGRAPSRLSALFPQVPVCSYDDLSENGRGFDTLVHLAVLNNFPGIQETEAARTNVDFAVEVLETAKRAGIENFVNISSIHALDAQNTSIYARTKRIAAEILENQRGIRIKTYYLPAVVTSQFSGKLGFLNGLPSSLQRGALAVLSTLKPKVHISRVAKAILAFASGNEANLPPEIISDTQLKSGLYSFVKRAVDVVSALLVIALLWWLMIAIYVTIRLETPGPGLFRQVRVGRNGAHFTCYKFRSMGVNTPNVATHQVAAHAVTKVGAFLRKTKLDELPQVWNILRNEMSLIGPRPCLPSQTELTDLRNRYEVLSLKPGISGYAQINDIDMSDPQKLAIWDARYLALQGLILDLKIGIATLRGKGGGDKIR